MANEFDGNVIDFEALKDKSGRAMTSHEIMARDQLVQDMIVNLASHVLASIHEFEGKPDDMPKEFFVSMVLGEMAAMHAGSMLEEHGIESGLPERFHSALNRMVGSALNDSVIDFNPPEKPTTETEE